jgi:hypothetical protein
LRNSPHLSKNTVKHWVVWLSTVVGCTALSYIIASAIPVFGGLVNLIGATFGTFICIQPFVRNCCFRCAGTLLTSGRNVAVGQLEETKPRDELVPHGRLERIHHRYRLLLHGRGSESLRDRRCPFMS